MNSNIDTIFALSTADISSAICVFRISGVNSYKIAQILTQKSHFEHNKIYYNNIYDPQNLEKIDSGIIFFKKSPFSFTGEDAVEIQLHGSRAVIKKMYHTLSEMPLCRPAEAGEFTKKAFLNQKIDIFQAEALSDLISSQTDYQRRMSQSGLSGSFSKFVVKLREEVIKLNAYTHALIDFADDEVPETVEKQLADSVNNQILTLNNFLRQSCNVSEIKSGLKIVIIGKPNVGKSSFINNILGRNAVIVSEVAGTTRDVLEFTLDIKGYPVIFFDTAGIRETNCSIEMQGIALAKERILAADLIFHLQDPTNEQNNIEDLLQEMNLFDNVINIFTKKDIYHHNVSKKNNRYFYISNVSRETIDPLLDFIACFFEYYYDNSSQTPLLNQRYVLHIKKILTQFKIASKNLEFNDFFLFSEDMQIIQYEIEKMTCSIDTEELLDTIFSTFCIGK